MKILSNFLKLHLIEVNNRKQSEIKLVILNNYSHQTK